MLAAIKTAKKYGTVISYDLNYRPSMWSAIGGKEKAQEVNKEIAGYPDTKPFEEACKPLHESVLSENPALQETYDAIQEYNKMYPSTGQ